jgi:Skp family chaperone for outer membrane proteins
VQFRISFASLAIVGLTTLSSAWAQNNAQPAAPQKIPTSVAVVDVEYVLENHPRFKADIEALQAEMAQAQEQIESRRKELLSQSEALGASLNADTPEFKQKQESLISQEGKLRLDFMNKEKEFAERRAKLMYDAFTQVTTAVSAVAVFKQYDLVVRYNRKQNEMDPKKPQTVAMGVQREVIFHNPQFDISDTVVAVLKRDIPAVAPSPVPPTGGNGQRQAVQPVGPIRK